MKNCFYFRYINKIGGIEQFYYYLAKKYNDYDITIIYNDGDYNQIKRLSKLVRCIKYKSPRLMFSFLIITSPLLRGKSSLFYFCLVEPYVVNCISLRTHSLIILS